MHICILLLKRSAKDSNDPLPEIVATNVEFPVDENGEVNGVDFVNPYILHKTITVKRLWYKVTSNR